MAKGKLEDVGTLPPFVVHEDYVDTLNDKCFLLYYLKDKPLGLLRDADREVAMANWQMFLDNFMTTITEVRFPIPKSIDKEMFAKVSDAVAYWMDKMYENIRLRDAMMQSNNITPENRESQFRAINHKQSIIKIQQEQIERLAISDFVDDGKITCLKVQSSLKNRKVIQKQFLQYANEYQVKGAFLTQDTIIEVLSKK